jgi:hypothetical protein
MVNVVIICILLMLLGIYLGLVSSDGVVVVMSAIGTLLICLALLFSNTEYTYQGNTANNEVVNVTNVVVKSGTVTGELEDGTVVVLKDYKRIGEE